MDIQLTDFENTSLIVMLSMLVNIINHFNLDFIIPIKYADVNMERAHKRNGVLNEKFWFNKNFVQSSDYTQSNLHKSDFLSSKQEAKDRVEPEYEEFYIHEILAGKKGTDFKGIVPIMQDFMKLQKYSDNNMKHITHFTDFLIARANGNVPTGAKFIRDFVNQAPSYKKNSNVTACTRNLLVK